MVGYVVRAPGKGEHKAIFETPGDKGLPLGRVSEQHMEQLNWR